LSEEDDEEDEQDSCKEKKSKKKRKSSGGVGGLNAQKEISKELAKFLGNRTGQMSRPQIVKQLWDYIKEHDLQNPNDRREILLDSKMRKLFNVDKFTMFSMNKYVGAHIHPFKPVNLNELSENSKKKEKRCFSGEET